MFVHHLKLRPPHVLPAWMERPIVRKAAEHSGIVSVVAGPGYGKTVLAAQIFASWAGPKLWYSLDAGDGDLAVFAAHFDAMLRGIARAPQVEGDAWRLGSIKEIASLFAGAFGDLESSALLVFDDVHLIEQSRSLEVLEEIARRLSSTGATVILAGRSMPLALHAFAAAGRLMRTGAVDLAFDTEQSRTFLARSNPNLWTEADVRDLIGRAEGWPAGLALVSSTRVPSGEAGSAGVGDGGDGAHQLLFDYLAAEVLLALDERERRFLLESSVLEDLEVSLCAEVTGCPDAERLLRSFTARGLFVTRRSDAAFTAHRLFHEFLRAELARSYASQQVAALHARAADAYLRRGDDVRAIEHRLAAGDYDAALGEIEANVFAFVATGLLSRVRAFLEAIGRERVDASATLLAARGRLQQLRGEWDDALASLERAMRLATEREQYAVLAEALRAVSLILASRGEFGRLDAILARALALPLAEPNRTALLSTQSALYVDIERYDDAVRLFAEIMPSIVARGDLALQGMVLHNTGTAHVRRGDPYAALACYERALKIKASAGQRVSALVTLANQIFVMVLVGDADEAERVAGRFLAECEDLDNATMLAYCHAHLGSIALARGDPAEAAEAYRRARDLCDPGDVLVLPDILHGYARALFEDGDAEGADELCVKAMKAMRTVDRLQPLAPLAITRARCAFARGDHERGIAFVEESLELSKAGDDALLRTMVDLDAAAALVRASAEIASAAKRARLDALARTATERAVALMDGRDYRFLLRTKAEAFATLREARTRWSASERGAGHEDAIPGAPLEIEMLGGLRVSVSGEALPPKAWTRRKARDLFAHLVTLQGRLCSRARLVDMHWPDVEGDTAHDLLRVTVSAIRKAVGNVIRYEEGGYRFVPPPHTIVDVDVFERHIEAARAAEALGAEEAARDAFARAVEAYRGDFLEGAEEAAWLWRERERVRKPYLAALRWLVRHPSDDRARDSALLDRLLDETPFDLEAVKLRLDALARELRLRDAFAEYERWKSAYRTMVGGEAPEIWRPPLLASR